jgi:hypothetical protein
VLERPGLQLLVENKHIHGFALNAVSLHRVRGRLILQRLHKRLYVLLIRWNNQGSRAAATPSTAIRATAAATNVALARDQACSVRVQPVIYE